MPLTDHQQNMLSAIHPKLRDDDRSFIAKITGFTPEYVNLVLNPATEYFNMKVVEKAAEIISRK